MSQSDMKQPSSNTTVFAALGGILAGFLCFWGWDMRLLTAILVAVLVFFVLWWLLAMMFGSDASAESVAAPAPTPEPLPTPAAPAPVAPMAEVVAPAAAVMQAPVAVTASVEKPRAPAKPKAAAPAAKAAEKPAPKPAPAKAAKVAKPDGPLRLSAPRKGKADDLKEIEGIGPALEKLCNSLGFYHFDQIAAWSDEDVAWVDANMKTFKGRILRDKWIAQCKIIVAEGLDAFRIRAKTNDY